MTPTTADNVKEIAIIFCSFLGMDKNFIEMKFNHWAATPEAQALITGLVEVRKEDEKILDAVELIRKQSGVYIWAYPITYRDNNGKIEKVTYGWELEWPSGKTAWYKPECNYFTYFEALNEAIKAAQ